MFVTRAARRSGVGSLVLRELASRARRAGCHTLRLETGNRQLAAIKLYESVGFARIEAFGPYPGDATSVCFEKFIGDENITTRPMRRSG
jgi:putative acetyltransferase